jgi:Polyketide cyclase / dehydrase and lipid transport
MPIVEAEALVAAPAEEVFKVLHDPTRHPEWWLGLDAIEGVRQQDEELRFAVLSQDFPGDRLEQRQEPLPGGGGIVMTCLQYGVRYRWRLVPEGDATRIHAQVEIPDRRRELTDAYRVKIPASLQRLTALVTAP